MSAADGPVFHRPACATCGAAGTWRKAQRGHLVLDDGRYICGNCGTTAPVPRRVPCGSCGTTTRVHSHTLRRAHSWPYGDAMFVCRVCCARTHNDIRCTRPECQNTGVPAATVPPAEYLCDGCEGDWVYAKCVSCMQREKRRGMLREKRSDPKALHIAGNSSSFT